MVGDELEPAARENRRGVRRLAVAAAVATLVLIAMGGVVRATDSGLACPDWPACYGQWIPPADLAMWLEHSHRLWAGVVMLLVAALAIWTTLHRHRARWVWRLSVSAALLVLLQAALGAAVVLALLPPGLVATHLATSLLVLSCLIGVAILAAPEDAPSSALRRPSPWSVGAALAVFGQAVLGSWASGHGIAYVFNAVPFWTSGETWTASARQTLHLAHRGSGYLVVLAVFGLAFAARRRPAPDGPRWRHALPDLAVVLVVVQVGLGLANVLTKAADAVAAMHLAVASWLWAVVVAQIAAEVTPKPREGGLPEVGAPPGARQIEAARR